MRNVFVSLSIALAWPLVPALAQAPSPPRIEPKLPATPSLAVPDKGEMAEPANTPKPAPVPPPPKPVVEKPVVAPPSLSKASTKNAGRTKPKPKRAVSVNRKGKRR